MKVQTVTWEGVQAVEVETAVLRLVAVHEYGPRIAYLGKKGKDNILLWEPGKYQREAPGRETWDLRGGHRTWMAGPTADECEGTYNADNAPAECEVRSDGFVLSGARDDQNGTRRGIAVTVQDEGVLEVDSFITNDSDMLLGAAVWALTCTVPNDSTRYVIPLGDESSFNTATVVLFNEWAGHGQKSFADEQYAIEQDAMVITPQGRENKRMVQSHAGIIAMSDPDRGLTFAKHRAFSECEAYPLACNIAAYVGPDNFMVEMETMGREACVKPGTTLHHQETWVVRTEAMGELTGSAARGLFD